MAENKEPIGFPTQAREIEQAFTKVQRELEAKKTNWASLIEQFDPLQKKVDRVLKEMLDKGDLPTREGFIFYETNFLIILVCKLGTELTEMHERLTKCEKAIKNLNLKVK